MVITLILITFSVLFILYFGIMVLRESHKETKLLDKLMYITIGVFLILLAIIMVIGPILKVYYPEYGSSFLYEI